MKLGKGTGRAMTMPGGIAVGTGISLCVTMALSLVVAWLVERGILRQENVGYGVMGVLLLSSAWGSAVAKSKVERKKNVVCLAAGGCYFLSLLAITASIFGGQYSAVGVTGLLILGGSGVAALMGSRVRRRGKVGGYTYSNR